MKIIKYFIVINFFLTISCTVQIPINKSISTPDYNGRKEVNTPAFRYKLNYVGIASTVIATAGGGYLGYKYLNIAEKYDKSSETVKSVPIANAALGGLVGLGFASLTNYLIWKDGQVKYILTEYDLTKWMNKYDKNQSVLTNSNYQYLTIIDNNKPNSFIIKTLQDVHDFNKIYKNPTNIDDIVTQSITNLNREDLLVVNQYYPNSTKKFDLADRYINLSKNIDECTNAYELFPTQRSTAEVKGIKLIKSVNDAQKYVKKFGLNNYQNEVELATISTLNNINQVEKFQDIFYNSTNVKQLEKQVINILSSLNDFDKYLKLFPNAYYLEDIVLKLSDKLSQIDIRELIKRYPNNNFNTELINKYIQKSNSIEDLIDASKLYPNHKLNIEKIAFDKIINAFDADEFLYYFPISNYRSTAEEKLVNYLNQEMYSFKSNIDKFDFIIKYDILRNNKGIATVKSVNDELERMKSKYRNNFLNLNENIPSSNKLIFVTFKTDKYPAYLAIDVLEKCIIVKDNFIPWVTNIHYSGSFGNEGFIIGEWYKEGIDNYWWGSSGKDEVSRFISKTKKLALASFPDITSYKAEYFGSRDADRKERSRSYHNSSSSSSKKDCGCKIKSIKDEGWLIKNGHDTVKFENGYSVPIKFDSGKWRVLGIFFDDKYDSYQEMMGKVVEDCIKSRCK